MSHCCGYHHHHHHCWCPGEGYEEPYPPYPHRYAGAPREDYLRRLEEERDLQERRLRRLEQELEELRRQRRGPQE
jgi:hypothetical protein